MKKHRKGEANDGEERWHGDGDDEEEQESQEYQYHCQGCGYQDETLFRHCPVCADIAALDEEEDEDSEEYEYHCTDRERRTRRRRDSWRRR